MNNKIIIDKKDASKFILSPQTLYGERFLDSNLSYHVEGYKFNPKFKSGVWDGKIHFFSQARHECYLGLWDEVINLLRKQKFDLEFRWKFQKRRIRPDTLDKWLSENSPFELRYYQREAFIEGVINRRLCIEIPTSGGKTILIYLFAKYFFQEENKKVLIIVPKVQLVEQTYSEFFELKPFVGRVYALYKEEDKPILISTWQSLQKKKKYFFKQFDVLIIDEAHTVKADVLKKICEKCENAWDRIGLSGTYPNKKYAQYWSIVASIGPVKRFVTYEELVENDFISDFTIKTYLLLYPNNYVQKFDYVVDSLKKIHSSPKTLKIAQYNLEQDFAFFSGIRLTFLISLFRKLKKNAIFLFSKREYGQTLYNLFQKWNNGKQIYYIDGTVKVSDREFFKKQMEENDNVVIIASFGTFSEGINIKNVHYIIFCNSYKSKIRIIQSIGRGLRKFQNKKAIIIDLVDVFKDSKYFPNIIFKHFKNREKYYKDYKMNYEIKRVFLSDYEEKSRKIFNSNESPFFLTVD